MGGFGPNYWGPYPAAYFQADWLDGVEAGTSSGDAPLMVYDETHNVGWMGQYLEDDLSIIISYMVAYAAGLEDWYEAALTAATGIHNLIQSLDEVPGSIERIEIPGKEINVIDGLG